MSRFLSIPGAAGSVAMQRAAAAVVAALLGIFILYGVGFARITHDTAHDTRHAAGFACH